MTGILQVRGAINGSGYTLLRPFAGGASSLFEAQHHAIPGTCVVRLFPEVGAGSDAALRIESGARSALALRQGGAARVFDFSVTGQQPVFVAMERIGGRSVEQVMADDGIFPLPLAIEVVGQVARTLRAAHAMGIVHGDLHPGAIRLTEAEHGAVVTKVLGFGWAKESRAVSGDRRHAIYRAPEKQQPGDKRGQKGAGAVAVDQGADQFALAAIAYEMLAGCAYLSEESSDLADPEARRMRQPPRISEMVLGLPAGVDDVLRKALSYDRRERFGDLEDFARALRHSAGISEPVTPLPETPGPEVADDGDLLSIEEALTASFEGRHAAAAPASSSPASKRGGSSGEPSSAWPGLPDPTEAVGKAGGPSALAPPLPSPSLTPPLSLLTSSLPSLSSSLSLPSLASPPSLISLPSLSSATAPRDQALFGGVLSFATSPLSKRRKPLMLAGGAVLAVVVVAVIGLVASGARQTPVAPAPSAPPAAEVARPPASEIEPVQPAAVPGKSVRSDKRAVAGPGRAASATSKVRADRKRRAQVRAHRGAAQKSASRRANGR